TILVVPVTRQAQSAADAVAIITEARQLGADLPIQKIIIAFNDVHGSTADAPGDAFDALRRLAANGVVVKCHIEKCLSEVWPNIESDTVDFARLAAMTPQEYSAHFGVSAFVGMRGANDFKAWRQRSMAALAEVLFPPQKGEGVQIGAKKTSSGGFGS
ncbi:MAG: hypothetical protein P4M15_12240, partial [Alphaproteobacteria bacterium]|nr:hypothetical protein [Alphaproteobacteria bacterium]